jgi:hypothetical protein
MIRNKEVVLYRYNNKDIKISRVMEEARQSYAYIAELGG